MSGFIGGLVGLFGSGPLVGVDIGASAVKIVSGTRRRSDFLIQKLSVVPLPYRAVDDRGIANADVVLQGLERACEAFGSQKFSACVNIRGTGLFTKRIVIPKIAKKEIPDQVRWEAEQVFPQDISTVLVEHLLLGESTGVPGAPPNEKGWDLMLVGAPAADIAGLKETTEQSGIRVKCMDLDAFAVSDFLEGFIPSTKEAAVAIVDLGASATRVVVRHDKRTLFVREFPIGGNSFTETISTALGVDFDSAESLKLQGDSMPQEAMDALATSFTSWRAELQNCEDTFVSQTGNLMIGEWHWIGGASLTPGLAGAIRSDRLGEKTFLFPADTTLIGKGKKADPEFVRQWAPRLISAAAAATRKA
jgi:type IV pilus assembly protein PilM